jgi:hypothetical protein
MTTVLSDIYVGLDLSTILNTILYELGQLVGTTESYNKFTRSFLVRKLNDRQNKFVYHSQCIRKTAYLLCKADYKVYKLPSNCMDGGVIGKPKYYTSSDDYTDLDIVSTDWLDENETGWLVGTSSTPEYAYFAPSYGNIPMLGVYPAPDTDGTSYSIDPDTGVVTGGDLPAATNNITGAATGGGTATSLQDTVVDFTTLGLVEGMAVLNVTDGSVGNIVTIAAHTITTSAITGGTDNTWTAGDSYNILAGEYGVITSWEDDEVAIFSSELGEISNITVPAGNLRVDYVPYPMAFPEYGNDLQYPEIPKLYHMDFAMGVVADCLKTFTEGSKEFKRADYYEKLFTGAVIQARTKKSSRPFNEFPISIRPGWPTRRASRYR